MKSKKQSKIKKAATRRKTSFNERPLHRRISLHPVSILLLLCVGVIMLGSTIKAMGESTSVSMTISATPLTNPATITSPLDQERFKTPDITVKGTCPDGSYIKLYKNDTFNGAAPCENNKFEIVIALSKGTNTLQVRVFNFSNMEGPKSNGITVYYDAPEATFQPNIPGASPPILPRSSLASTDPFRIITDYEYKVHISGQPVKIDLALAGGTAPYALAVDWNDGKIEPIPRQDKLPFQIVHAYSEKPRLHTYVIKVAASDLDGNKDYIQLMAAVDRNAFATPSGTTTPAKPGIANEELTTWLKYLWPGYLIVILMVLCFYLGEREEHRILSRKNRTLSPR